MNTPFRHHPGYDPLGDCGKGKCPVCARNQSVMNIQRNLPSSKEFQSDAVSPFVGRYGFPNINLGILTPPKPEEDSILYDAPKYWSYKNYDIPKIVGFRSSLLNSRNSIDIKHQNKLLEIAQDVSMSSRPADIDITLEKNPTFRLITDAYSAPTGPAAALKQARLTSNPKIHTKVQKVFSDTDLKAKDALVYLYDNKFDENALSRMLSVGTMGLKFNRKLTPTRWSITATDDTLGKHLIEEIKDYPQMNYRAYFGGYLGNYYLILFFSEVWGYELFETYTPSTHSYTDTLRTMTDHETYEGRKNYAEDTSGGYYTVRLAIAEKLKTLKRQGLAIALRFITDEYTMPLGVWVTREATRKTLDQKPLEFASKDLMLEYARKLVKRKFNANADHLLSKSVLLKGMKEQRKLASFFS